MILEELRLAMFCVGASRVGDSGRDARLVRCDGRPSDGPARVRRSRPPTRTAAARAATTRTSRSPRGCRRRRCGATSPASTRSAGYTDDLGDESGDRAVAMRRLRRWRDETRESFEHDERTHPVLVALADTVADSSWTRNRSSTSSTPTCRTSASTRYEDWPTLRGVLHTLRGAGRAHRAPPVRHSTIRRRSR